MFLGIPFLANIDVQRLLKRNDVRYLLRFIWNIL